MLGIRYTHIRLQQRAQLVEQLTLLCLRLEDVHFGWTLVYGAQAAQLVEGAEIEIGLGFLLLLLLLLLLLSCLLVHVAAVCGDNYRLLLLLLLLDVLRIRRVLYV